MRVRDLSVNQDFLVFFFFGLGYPKKPSIPPTIKNPTIAISTIEKRVAAAETKSHIIIPPIWLITSLNSYYFILNLV
jgi:hypothetical protein